MKPGHKRSLQLLLSLGIAGAFAALLYAAGLPLIPEASALSDVAWWSLPAYFLIWCVVHYLRAARWQLLLVPLGHVPMRRVLAVSFVGFAAIQILPFRAGEVVRPLLIRQRSNVSGWAATGTIAAERIVDGLFLTVMLAATMAWAVPLSPLPERIGDLPISPAIVPQGTYAALLLFTCAFIAMGLFYFRRDFARRATSQVVGVVSPRLAAWLALRVEKVAKGLEFLPRWRLSVPFVAATALYWLLNAAATLILARGVGLELFTYSEACVVTGVLALGILVPNAPGFFGAFQFSIYAALALYYPQPVVLGPGAVFVFYVYVLQLAVTALGGLIGLSVEHPALGGILRAPAAALDDMPPNLAHLEDDR